uniref:Chromosome 9 open reading frame 24 n=1 Tax=Athene cunicularia TaxID=194338 RepID=A0A663NBY7_ATHCN
MFLFSKKHKTPISTYTDSYRPPCSVRKTIQKQTSQQLCSENRFVTPGEQSGPSSCPPTPQDTPACHFCIADKYKSVFANKDKYLTWRTDPCSSTVWNRYSSCLPLPPKVESSPPGLPKLEPPQVLPAPQALQQKEREMATDMLPRLPVYSVTGRGPYWGYYSPCSACHHCLRGMDYYIDGASAIRGQLHTIEEREYPMLHLQPQSNVLCIYTLPPVILSVQEP